jgi:hypothetical protein
MDKQRQARCRVLKGAHITFKGHWAAIDCVVRNLSDRGACLKVESPIGIPDSFDPVLGGPGFEPRLTESESPRRVLVCARLKPRHRAPARIPGRAAHRHCRSNWIFVARNSLRKPPPV